MSFKKSASLFSITIITFFSSCFAFAQSFFKNSYEDSQREFISMAKENWHKFEFKGSDNRTYAIDYIIKPALSERNNLLIVISGTHGIEGFVGSAIQRHWLAMMKDHPISNDSGIVFIHGLNPFGFSNFRRVNENNVDLNRNFVIDPKQFSKSNDNYQKIEPFLNPDSEASTSIFSKIKFYAQALKYILEFSLPVVRQGILQGQYQFAKGLYFGGMNYQPQKNLIDFLIRFEVPNYKRVFIIDLHTGYGQRKKLHLLASSEHDSDAFHLKKVFGDNAVDFGDQKNFYKVDGDLIGYMTHEFNKQIGTQALGITFEFGTLDSQKTTGSVESLNRMVLENQSWWNKAKTENDLSQIQTNFREMFYPSEIGWQESCLEQSDSALEKVWNYLQSNGPQ